MRDREKVKRREGKHINKSLLALTNVIRQLSIRQRNRSRQATGEDKKKADQRS